ncbi:MAG: GntR family transcriptional regulator [Armatimonadota bacterium]|nr:GntR family transcriptional regulator [Armatimonadota bacterium]MDR5696836.1 GntR family transcriptional regulator [Armatimonadota bacterium]
MKTDELPLTASHLPLAVDGRLPEPLHAQLAEQIRWLVALEELKPGDRLPTVQDLADHLRVHRNTVAAVYASLQEEGYLVSRRGVGTFVAESETTRLAVQRAALREVVDRALERAVELGFTATEFAEAAAARARMHEARKSQRAVLFVECNIPEIEQHSATLARELGVDVVGGHLDEVRRDRAAFRRRAAEVGWVVTTFFHFEEVRRIVGRSAEVVGVGAGLEIRFLRSLAQLRAGTRVAVCCLDRERAAKVRTLVVGAGVRHLKIASVGVDDPDRFRRALEEADEVYVSTAAYPVAEHLAGRQARLRTYQMELDRASVEMLRARLAEAPPVSEALRRRA